MRRVLAPLMTLAWIAYPVAVYLALRGGQVRGLAVGMLVVMPTLALLGSGRPRGVWSALRPVAPALAVALVTLVVDDPRWLMALPVVVNAALLLGFAGSLQSGGPSAIERFARLGGAELPAGGIAYCRRVTWVWCGFFVVNGAVAGVLALRGPPEVWALYTGLLSYLAMGCLFAAEYVVRKARFREYGSGLHDRVLARCFPPRTDSPGGIR